MTSPALTNRVFLAATAAVALHVADDNFVQPPGGTTAADHLVSGLVPLALLGLAAWSYPRVRAGAAGVIALSVGLSGLVVGLIEAGYYTQEVGPSGDDYSGFLAGRGRARAARAGLPPALAVPSLRRALVPQVRPADAARRRCRGGGELRRPPHRLRLPDHARRRGKVPAPHLGAAYEDVTVTTSDGLELAGWYVPSKNGAASSPSTAGPRRSRTPGCSRGTATAC